MSLIKNNARVAAQIAVALERVETECGGGGKLHAAAAAAVDIPVVIGGSILDVHYRVLDDNLEVSCIPFIYPPAPRLKAETKTNSRAADAESSSVPLPKGLLATSPHPASPLERKTFLIIFFLLLIHLWFHVHV